MEKCAKLWYTDFKKTVTREGRKTELRILSEWHGLTIKKILLDRLKFSRAAVTALKTRENGITVNGERKTVRFVVSKGDLLSLKTEDTEPSPRIQPSEGPLDILYEDEAFLAVNKPGGMAVHPSKKLQDDTLAGRILFHRFPLVFRAAGRLDKDTSGVVLCAKSQVVSAKFFHLIRDRRIEKEYLLLAKGEKEPPASGEIDLCIRRDPESYISRVCFAADGTQTQSETALTRFLLLKSRPPYHLFLASPITGRTHQLRAHFSAIGFPLAGDTLYGEADPILDRQGLHCLRLRFPHPESGDPQEICAPLPEDLRRAILSIFGEIPAVPTNWSGAKAKGGTL
ncbi:MAG: RluA family pseudouridine synthase [Clostridia bacterium]|nr:RluA family pseudouridine synthase [Clostridia bacterium]